MAKRSRRPVAGRQAGDGPAGGGRGQASEPPLSSREVEAFRRRLLAKGKELAARLEQILSGKNVDLLALAEMKPKRGESREDRLRRFLGLVDRGIKRARSGGFGECLDCGEALGRPTLEAAPWTERCEACEALLSEQGPAE
jgi:RNA polymerase-binding transcription factor DksA